MENLTVLFSVCPAVSLWLVAVVVALVRWQLHPVVSSLVLVAGVLEILVRVSYAVVPRFVAERGVPMTQMSIVYGALSFVGLIASGLVLTAVFIGRGPVTRAPVDPTMIR